MVRQRKRDAAEVERLVACRVQVSVFFTHAAVIYAALLTMLKIIA